MGPGPDYSYWTSFYDLLAGYEDCNDLDTLRSDPVFKLISGRGESENRDKELRISAHWPHLAWFRKVCQGSTISAVPSPSLCSLL